ncbi:efflux RND transporter permease subunit [Enterobacter mori]|uniref:efflux RND transporter permease subunit n=1 Tax=Enterobacter mori TaxID=539813 RepID=UPI003B84204F
MLITVSLKYRVLVIVLFLAGLVWGITSFKNVPVDAFPDVTPVQVNIYTEAPGLAAEETEKLLTIPVESGMASLPGVREVRSMSLAGLSFVSVYFTDKTDVYQARQWVREKIEVIRGLLPEEYDSPELGANSSGLGQVFWYTLESEDDTLDTMELRTLHEWTIRMILKTVPGVDDIVTWGGQEKQYQVTLEPAKMVKYNIALSDVLAVLSENNRMVGGQNILSGEEQYLVRGDGTLQTLEDIAALRISTLNGLPIFIRDVGHVELTPATRTGAVTQNGEEVVMGMALARINENASHVVAGIKDKIENVINTLLPENVRLIPLYDRTELVDLALDTARSTLVEGAILIIIVLFLFLGEFRSALVVIIMLPGSVLLAFIMMEQFAVSANLMSLAGLAMGMGMMVDGAVVMVENIHRRLADAGKISSQQQSRIVLEAAREVGTPVLFAIAIIVMVFLPLFTLEGLEGKLFKPMVLTISFAMLGSLLLSLTVVPVLSSLIIRPAQGDLRSPPFLLRFIRRYYDPILEWVLTHKKSVSGIVFSVLFAVFSLFPFLGKTFMPQLQCS